MLRDRIFHLLRVRAGRAVTWLCACPYVPRRHVLVSTAVAGKQCGCHTGSLPGAFAAVVSGQRAQYCCAQRRGAVSTWCRLVRRYRPAGMSRIPRVLTRDAQSGFRSRHKANSLQRFSNWQVPLSSLAPGHGSQEGLKSRRASRIHGAVSL